eukprot:TRINITY_DN12147_c0_g1_i3.p1 TRINITY_DN12147_c0_g1~~TRINITY_DN12147_c0_g1_i3.p1  ORF type:complete len:577 (+),score=184.36 TRINITY_DN12147_c0_g1_i3:176-1732(+)
MTAAGHTPMKNVHKPQFFDLPSADHFVNAYFTTSSPVPMVTYSIMYLAAQSALSKHSRWAKVTKRNLVLYDRRSLDFDWPRLQEELRKEIPDAQVMKLEGQSREEVIKLMREAKATVVFDMVGGNSLNFEAVLFGACTILGTNLQGPSFQDLPIPSYYHIDKYNFSSMYTMVREVLLNYPKHVPQFSTFRRASWLMPHILARNVRLVFSSRDIMFRTYCRTFDECRAALALVFSIRALFPLAWVEVLTPQSFNVLRDNDGILNVAPYESFFRLVQTWTPLMRPLTVDQEYVPRAAMFTQLTDLDAHRYTVFLEPRTLLLGREFVNEAVRMLSDPAYPLPFVGGPQHDGPQGWGPVVAESKTYWKLVRDLVWEDDFVNRTLRAKSVAVSGVLHAVATRHQQSLQHAFLPQIDRLPLDMVHLPTTDDLRTAQILLSPVWKVPLSQAPCSLLQDVASALDPVFSSNAWQVSSLFFPSVYRQLGEHLRGTNLFSSRYATGQYYICRRSEEELENEESFDAPF